MTDLGAFYALFPTEVVNTINGIIQDGLKQAQEALNPNYKLSWRNVEPLDTVIGPAAAWSWNNTFNTVASERVCGVATQPQVPNRQAIIHFGWYCSNDLGLGSRLYIEINGKTRNRIDARTVWEQPGHVLFTPDRIIFAKETDNLSFYAYNGLAYNVSANIAPLAVLYGEPGVLGID